MRRIAFMMTVHPLGAAISPPPPHPEQKDGFGLLPWTPVETRFSTEQASVFWKCELPNE